MNDSSLTRALFLKNFVRALIISSNPELLAKFKEAQKTKVELKQIEQMKPLVQVSSLPPSPRIEVKREPLVHEEMQASQRMPAAIPLSKQEPPVIIHPSAVKILPSEEEIAKQPPIEIIMNLLSDASVQSIECRGAGKPLVLIKIGFTQTTKIIFSEEQIKSVLKDFSAKTKIPLLPGVFKVAYQNLLVTAVVSEFVGNRFIIQKRPPQQPLQLPINQPAQRMPPQIPPRVLPRPAFARPQTPPSMFRK